MVTSKRERFENLRDELQRISGETISESDYEHIIDFLDAKDPECGIVNDPNDSTKADGTLSRYAYNLKRVADLADFELTDTTVDELNHFLNDMRNGRIDGVKDNGLAEGTVANYQKTLRKFYNYHRDIGIEKDQINLLSSQASPVDERDVFDGEDIKALREAAKHPRDKALVDLLLYTGQRISAILNLRLKDIDVDEGIFHLNTDNGDMKGADGKRPLLYAEKAVREWMRKHPCDDPEAYFICQKVANVGSNDYEVGQRMDNSSIYHLLQNIGDRAGVDKPVNPHNFRHSATTIYFRDENMDKDTIKRLLGHDLSSTVMETTYAHITDQDVIDAAEEATGIKEEDDSSPLTPDICDNCGEPIPIDDAVACPSCGIAFSPAAKQVEDQMEEDLWEAKGNAVTETDEQAVDVIKQIHDEKPEVIVQALMDSSDLSLEDVMDSDS